MRLRHGGKRTVWNTGRFWILDADFPESNLLIDRHRLSYTPVRSRLTSLMGSNVVRLTDRAYMRQLASKLQKDYEARQRARIERRKLKATTVVPKLCELLPKSLLRTARRRRECAPKFHAEAVKKCKQLPQLLLADDSELWRQNLNVIQ